jgi:predicted lipid-binding transport protein (Tim44 family)
VNSDCFVENGQTSTTAWKNIALREPEIDEVWTENGDDFITVRLHVNLLDSTVDGRTAAVVNGSNFDPIDFEDWRSTGRSTVRLVPIRGSHRLCRKA